MRETFEKAATSFFDSGSPIPTVQHTAFATASSSHTQTWVVPSQPRGLNVSHDFKDADDPGVGHKGSSQGGDLVARATRHCVRLMVD